MPVTGSRQGAGEAVRPAASRSPAGVPSWGPVLATTIRLWWQRRLRGLRRPGRALLAVVCVLAVAAVVVAVVALTGTSTHTARRTASAGSSAPARKAAPAARASASARASTRASAPSPLQQAQSLAAAWTASQLVGGQAIACDPAMCTTLAEHGVARARLRPLASPSAAPGADLIAAAPATDARLDQDAPVLLSSFGSGASEIELRAAYPGGAAAYQRALRSDLSSRRGAGTQLLHSKRIQAAAGTAQLRAGQVDSRVLVMLALLASQNSWRVVAFGGASPGVPATTAPYRQVVLTSAGGRASASGRASAPAVSAALALARGQHGAYQAVQVSTVRLAGGQTGLRVGFAAPSPLGLLAGASG